MENVNHVLKIVSNAPDMNLMNVNYALTDIILIVVRVFNVMKVVSFVQGPEIHNVNNVQQIITFMIVMMMEQEIVGIVMIAAGNVLLQLAVNV